MFTYHIVTNDYVNTRYTTACSMSNAGASRNVLFPDSNEYISSLRLLSNSRHQDIHHHQSAWKIPQSKELQAIPSALSNLEKY